MKSALYFVNSFSFILSTGYFPPAIIEPEVTVSRPAIRLRRVLFPQPLLPVIIIFFPAGIFRVILFKTAICSFPETYFFTRFEIIKISFILQNLHSL